MAAVATASYSIIVGADVFIGVSAPHILTATDIQKLARDPIVFALANPVPEIMPEEAAPFVRVIIPSVFNKKVVDGVARAVLRAAFKSGVARREREH